jgi:hypothetical protein
MSDRPNLRGCMVGWADDILASLGAWWWHAWAGTSHFARPCSCGCTAVCSSFLMHLQKKSQCVPKSSSHYFGAQSIFLPSNILMFVAIEYSIHR